MSKFNYKGYDIEADLIPWVGAVEPMHHYDLKEDVWKFSVGDMFFWSYSKESAEKDRDKFMSLIEQQKKKKTFNYDGIEYRANAIDMVGELCEIPHGYSFGVFHSSTRVSDIIIYTRSEKEAIEKREKFINLWNECL